MKYSRDTASPIGRAFVRLDDAGLETPQRGTLRVFADLDEDGVLDAITCERAEASAARTRWQRGRGDGTFLAATLLPVLPRPTIAIAVGDVDRDGHLDLYLGHDYRGRGTYEGYANELWLGDGAGAFRRVELPEARQQFERNGDAAGRPTYGVAMIPDWHTPGTVALLELGYGRRWNRVWSRDASGDWVDRARAWGIDGDAVRHGRHPAWLAERARTDARFARSDEPPFRANGNTFDTDVADIDGDGHLDLLLTEIAHAWAGASSDRTRVLYWDPQREGMVDRTRAALPREHAAERSWNEGDLFGALVDVDHDGRCDVIISSGDYPDDQRLRFFHQQSDGTFEDVTSALGIDHDGSQMLSLADVDRDGDLDVLVGQSFNRYSAEQRAGRTPTLALLRNDAAQPGTSIVLELDAADCPGVHRDALGAIVTAELPGGRLVRRVLTGIGGHAGKQHAFPVILGVGAVEHVEVTIEWPGAGIPVDQHHAVAPGRYRARPGAELEPVAAGSVP